MRLTLPVTVALVGAAIMVGCKDATTAPHLPTKPVTLDVCFGGVSQWFGYQNEGERWQQLASYNGIYRFNATDRVVIATASGDSDFSTVQLIYTTADGLSQLGCPPDNFGSKVHHGSVLGLVGQQSATVNLAVAEGYATPSLADYTLFGIPTGPHDLIASRLDTVSYTIDRMIIRRDQDFPDGATVPSLDFETVEAFTPVKSAITLTGAGAGSYSSVQGVFRTANGTLHFLGSGCASFTCPAAPIALEVPTDQLRPGDVHQVQVVNSGADVGNTVRAVIAYYHDAGDKTIALGPEPSTPSWTTVATSPYLRPRLQMPWQPEYGNTLLAVLFQSSSSSFRAHLVIVTKDYLGDAPQNWDITLPDFSTAIGFPSEWGLHGAAFEWVIEVMETPGGLFSSQQPVAGQTFRMAEVFSPGTISMTRMANSVAPPFRNLLRMPLYRGAPAARTFRAQRP